MKHVHNIFNADKAGLFYRTLLSRFMVQNVANIRGEGRMQRTGSLFSSLPVWQVKNSNYWWSDKQPVPGVSKVSTRSTWELITKQIERLGWQYHISHMAWHGQPDVCSAKRCILLFIDTCTAHPEVHLSNIHLVFCHLTLHVDCSTYSEKSFTCWFWVSRITDTMYACVYSDIWCSVYNVHVNHSTHTEAPNRPRYEYNGAWNSKTAIDGPYTMATRSITNNKLGYH